MTFRIDWTCPFCGHAAVITHDTYSSTMFRFNDGNREKSVLALLVDSITCPRPTCREYAIKARLHTYDSSKDSLGKELGRWQLRPNSSAKVFPDYIPKPIREDYEEACLIRDLSPKAAATLARRCLQGIIRDFWGISKARLVDEINELKGVIDQATWEAIDAVRSIGNIGAHMERDINLVIEVEPEEAQLLIGLIEVLLKDWYIARHERQAHLQQIVALAKSKKPAAT
ncbi:hypothetical protein Xthr_20950 [Xanthomonas citri pv. thirumalacharii]|nr:hypothetical protein [Xanthomonas citri pv. thirumalacharii]